LSLLEGELMPATRYESLLEAVPDALVGMDQKGVIRFVNRQTETLFGHDRDDLVGQPIETLLAETLWQVYAEHRDDYFSDPRTRSSGVELELIARHRNGREFPVNISLSHIDTGDVLLVVTAVHDVATQQQAVETAQLIASVVESSNDAIIGSTIEGMVTSWNPAAERMYGYSGKEIIGRSAGILSPQDRLGEIQANLVRIRAGETLEHLETVRVRKDGTAFPVSITVAPIRDEDGVIVGASAVHRDVTEQRRAFEVAQRMAAIVEGSDDAIFGRTLDGVITSWNPAAERMYGYSGQEIIGRSIKVLVPDDRVEELEALVVKINAGQAVERLETTRIRKDGTTFPVSLTVSPIHDADRAIIGASVIGRDMTRQKEAFEAARAMTAVVPFSREAIFGATLGGTITSWNPAAERIYGYSSPEIVGKTGRLITPPDRVDAARAVLTKIKAGQYVEHFETTCVRKDGTVFPVSLSVAPIRDPAGTIVGLAAVAHEVIERK
jgi:PAS domain S-box-containing protein